jgi:iron complex outermembrane receptor protein
VSINADAENYGAELQLETPVDGLDLSVGLAWIDATTKDVPLRAGSPLPPRDVRPTYTGVAGLGDGALFLGGPGGQMNVRADAGYSSDYYNLRNSAPTSTTRTCCQSRRRLGSEDDAWYVSLDAKNVTDEKAGMHYDLASLCGCNEVSYRCRAGTGSLRRSSEVQWLRRPLAVPSAVCARPDSGGP